MVKSQHRQRFLKQQQSSAAAVASSPLPIGYIVGPNTESKNESNSYAAVEDAG